VQGGDPRGVGLDVGDLFGGEAAQALDAVRAPAALELV
jgi:hypothetical protein